MQVLLVSPDMMFMSQLLLPVRTRGHKLGWWALPDMLANKLREIRDNPDEPRVEIVVLDLTLRIDDLNAFVAMIREGAAPGVKVIAFAPHVHEGSLANAEAAGCDLVFTRGQFVRN